MLRPRVMPVLLLDRRRLIKTERFGKPKYVGDPLNAIRIFNEKEVDELVLLDISATRRGVGPDFEILEQLVSECFMPVCYGGGVSSIEHAERLFGMGVEKVCLQTAAIEQPDLINELARRYGSQSIVVAVDVKKNWRGTPKVHHSARRRTLSLQPFELVDNVLAHGAGEILLTSVDHEGVRNGMDLRIIETLAPSITVPVICIGGVGSLDHIRQAFQAGADGVAVGSFFVFSGPHRAVVISYPRPEDIERMHP